MFEKLKEVIKNAHTPYYNFPVAAMVETKDGFLFSGVNVETASPSAGICAERNALYNAVAKGYKKGDFSIIYILNTTEKPVKPCFICRQALNDFCNPETDIISYGINGEEERFKVKDVCVFPFSDGDMWWSQVL